MASHIGKTSLLGSVSVSHRNLFGTGRYLGFETIQTQNRTRQDSYLTYREPFVGPWQIPVTLTIFRTDGLRQGAHLRQKGMYVEGTKVLGQQTLWSVRYEYRLSDCKIEAPGSLRSGAARNSAGNQSQPDEHQDREHPPTFFRTAGTIRSIRIAIPDQRRRIRISASRRTRIC
jgi:outer membrane protein assembly factor BamA